jgi:WD40 repeat protein
VRLSWVNRSFGIFAVLEQLMTTFFDTFISYGRTDSKEFARQLQTRLNQQGFRVWFDFNDIPLAVDFQNQIDDGIEKASHFLFLISPHSVNSPYCHKEIELAIKCNKRIIPLLHVMQISQETWLQRNPNGTALDWEAYKAKGLHDSYQNMHPTISKLNWVYFQENKDDFEKSLADLIGLLNSHTDYVQQHTKFLVKALEWERHKKQTNYLLVGEGKQQAQSWLKIRFEDQQPPCIPSDLHCEYITESIKNANNLMTQVFLSYANEDRETMEKIRRSLRRESITVWTNTTDIQTGEAFELAIKRGIEQADNVVYLLSPDSVNSTYCQLELNYALSLNKRIIPLLVRETDSMQVQSELRELHYIDLTDNLKEEDYLLDQSQLLKILHQDAAYYNEHKILLTKALNWKQQQNNPSILLRGYNLRSAETWLKVVQKRTQHPPTPLQEEFITESLQQPPLESLDVFISYSRADSDLARKLNDALQIQGKTTWFDQESIASGSDFQQEIYRGIKTCDNFLFILSERSVNSPYCQDEVEYASSLNKRFVTVLHREVNTADLHPELAKVQWIDFNGNEQDFNANFNQLVRTLDTDREHVHSHSKWLQRALEWEQKDKSDDLLLRGSEFAIAQNWLQKTEQQKKKPAATKLQQAFMEVSKNAIETAKEKEKHRIAEMLHLEEERAKEAEARLAEQKKSAKRQKFFLVAISIALVAAVGFWVNAEGEKKKAKYAQEAQLNSVSRFSLSLSKQNQKFDALLEAIKVGGQLQNPENKTKPETLSLIFSALQTAVYENGFQEQNRLTKHQGTVFDVAWSPDGDKIATAGGDGKVILWDRNGKEIKSQVVTNSSEVNSVSFSPNGKIIAFTTGKTAGIWNTEKKEKTIQNLTDKQEAFKSINFSPDGKTIATASKNGIIKLWRLNGQKFYTVKTFQCCQGNDYVDRVNFSSDGNTIVTVTRMNNFQLWSKEGKSLPTPTDKDAFVWSKTRSTHGSIVATVNRSNNNTLQISNKQGKQLQTLEGHEGSIKSVKFSPDGKTIATASEDNTVRLWSQSGHKLTRLQANENNQAEIWSVAWSPDGNTIVSARANNTIQLWTKDGILSSTQMKHQKAVSSVRFSPDGHTIASGSGDGTIKLWSKDGKELKTLEGNKAEVWSVAWSPDGNTIASGSGDGTIKLWSKEGKKPKTLEGNKAEIWSVAWSPDGNTIAVGSGDGSIKLWSKEGNFIRDIGKHNAPVASVAWSPDGNTIASASNDNNIKLWRWSQKESFSTTLKGHQNDVLSVTFSPDGKIIASASKDRTVKLWNSDGQELQTLNGHNKRVTSVSFSPNGKTLASASDDKTIILWNLADLKLNKLMKDACTQLKDYLEYNAPEGDRHLCQNINGGALLHEL